MDIEPLPTKPNADLFTHLNNSEDALMTQLHITQLLNNCVLSADFEIDRDWIQGLILTPVGQEVVNAASQAQADISIEALTFACFLQSPQLVTLSDSITVYKAISDAIKQKTLFFVNNIGREFHDEVARQHPKGKIILNNDETISVLQKLSIGVYQIGEVLVGPFGVFGVDHSRWLVPSLEMSGFLCDEQECERIHDVAMRTYREAQINNAMQLVSNQINNLSLGSPWENSKRRDLMEKTFKNSTDTRGIFDLLVDGLTTNRIQERLTPNIRDKTEIFR
jgi:hypothetical protein